MELLFSIRLDLDRVRVMDFLHRWFDLVLLISTVTTNAPVFWSLHIWLGHQGPGMRAGARYFP